MTVAELLRELQAMPNQNAPICVRLEVRHDPWDVDAPQGPDWVPAAVEDVRNEGPFVTIRTK